MVRNSGNYISHRPVSHGMLDRTGEVNGAVVVGIDLVDHVLELGLAGVLAERAHNGAQFLGGDLTCDAASSVVQSSWGTCVAASDDEGGRQADAQPRHACDDEKRRQCLRAWSSTGRRAGDALTITVFVLNTWPVSTLFGPQTQSGARLPQIAARAEGRLTNRENASLNSETCSSVRESAWDCVLAVVLTRGRRAIAMFCGAGYATRQEGHTPWLLSG
jgi:hypothetical protein